MRYTRLLEPLKMICFGLLVGVIVTRFIMPFLRYLKIF